MARCAKKVGQFGCPYDAHGAEPFPDLCYKHAKDEAGLFACQGSRTTPCAKPAGHKPPCSPVPAERRTVTPDSLFSDEEQEILRVLRREGA